MFFRKRYCADCGAFTGVPDSDCRMADVLCPECRERYDCKECVQEAVMYERLPPGFEHVPQVDEVYAADSEPDFDAEDD